MLENVLSRDELSSLARANARDYLTQSVNNKSADNYVAEGWTVAKRGKTSTRLTRSKDAPTRFEDRVWTMLYRMALPFLSGKGGANLRLRQDGSDLETQLDVVAIDEELALLFECRTSDKYARRSQLQEELSNLALLRERFAKAVNSVDEWRNSGKKTAVFAFFLENIQLSDKDRERAKLANIALFDEGDLEYYEKLVAHLGPAARYQFYADIVPGRTIPGLAIRVPAVKTKMGGHNCYTFPVSPEYLLKIAYVSHRARGKASDIHTYQRMMSKARLNKIREYISSQGIFPTNIVINVEKKLLSFQRIKQENNESEQEASGILGWLEIRPAYKSAWVIDGQHRLFSYSGHPRATSSHLSVLAFEGLSTSMQASLFVDINAKQKSVKQSLLQELHAELLWDAESASTRVQAIVSKAVQVLDADKASPLFGRILTADVQKDPIRCISLTSLYKAIARINFFVVRELKGEVQEYGPLWGGDNELTLKRVSRILRAWLSPVRDAAPDWWELGSAEGGGLTMNDGITACLNVLFSVMEHIEGKTGKLSRKDDDEFCEVIAPYANEMAAYLGALSLDERKTFRDRRGSQGQTYRTRQIQLELRKKFPAFSPTGLDEFFKSESEQTNLKAKVSIDRIERLVQAIVVQELKQNFSSETDAWWNDGIPKSVRVAVRQRAEEDDNKRGSLESYFDFMDYRKIVQEQWVIFQNILGYGKKNDSKDRQTKWFVEVNGWRNIVAHASSGRSVPSADLMKLIAYEEWVKAQAQGKDHLENLVETETE